MYRAADLFIKKNLPGELVDPGIRADGEFAQTPRSAIRIQHGVQEFLVLFGGGFGDQPVLELQRRAVNGIAAIDRREGKAHPAFYAVLDGSGEDLAIGELELTISVDETAALNAHLHIDVTPAHLNPLMAFQENAQ